MTALVLDFAAGKRRVLATRLRRAKRCDVCCYCGDACDIRDRLRCDAERGDVAHFNCWLTASGVQP